MEEATAGHLDRALAVAERWAVPGAVPAAGAAGSAGSAASSAGSAASSAGSAASSAAADGRAAALGLTVSRVDEPTGLFDRRYVPSLSVVLRGRKRSIVGDDDQVWGRERFIITPVDLPVVAGVVEAPVGGFVSAVWELDPAVVAEVAGAMVVPRVGGVGGAGRVRGADAGAGAGAGSNSGVAGSGTGSDPASLVPGAAGPGAGAGGGPGTGAVGLPRLGEWTAPLADAFARLLGLLDEPEEAPVLFPLLAREIVLRLLQTTQAPRILAALDGPGASVVASAVELLQTRMNEPWSMDRLARALAVSESTLFTRFKDATGMSPAQFLKRTRLGEARRRMVLHGETAARAASEVGYRSASHFSRDYREAYGRPPAEDAVRAREELVGRALIEAAV